MAVEIVRLKKEMIAVTAEVSKGLLMLTRTKHLENNEKCLRYFFRKLARPRNTMLSILNEEGKEQTETKDIHTFYTELYKEEVTDVTAMESLLSFLKGTYYAKLTFSLLLYVYLRIRSASPPLQRKFRRLSQCFVICRVKKWVCKRAVWISPGL